MTSPFQSIVVVGAGAVGSFFGAMLARGGHTVTLVARHAHAEAITRNGLQLHMGGTVESVPMRATTDLDAVRDADLVLFCVKSTDTAAVAAQIAPLLAAHTLVMSLQNGVDNAATIARAFAQSGRTAGTANAYIGDAANANRPTVPVVVPTVVYVATAMPEPGVVKHFGRGDLVIGPLDARAGDVLQARLQSVVGLFALAKVPVRISPDVMGELWNKLLVNCAYNAISAVTQTPYGQMAALPAIREVLLALVREVVAVAQADGQTMPLPAAIEAMDRIAVAMPGQLSSTAQDVARRKPSEIDHLNGFVVRRGAELGIATPVNQTMHALVKLIEAGYANAT